MELVFDNILINLLKNGTKFSLRGYAKNPLIDQLFNSYKSITYIAYICFKDSLYLFFIFFLYFIPYSSFIY